MSPLDAAEHIAAFIAQTIKTYETEQLGQKPFNVSPAFCRNGKAGKSNRRTARPLPCTRRRLSTTRMKATASYPCWFAPTMTT